MDSFLSKSQLHGLLRDQGHAFWTAEPDESPIDVSPPPETYLTVGLDVDCALKPAYRDHYFVCVQDDEGNPVIGHHPAFTLPAPFAALAGRDQLSSEFVLGPARWVLVRVALFGTILLWPRGGFRETDGLDFLLHGQAGEWFDEVPNLARWLGRRGHDSAQAGAVRLDPSNVADAEVIWEVAELVGQSIYDFYVSDAVGRDVYLLHHHDKIIVSIPDESARRQLLDELAGYGELFDDCSGYQCETDAGFD